MKDVNVVALTGNLTRDAEYRDISTGGLVSFSIAVNRSVKKDNGYEDVASFIECKLWGNLGKQLLDRLNKGTPVAIGGSLEQERWNNKDGIAQSRIVVKVSDIKIMKQTEDSRPKTMKSGEQFTDDIPF